jgi:hypothetical protein
MEMKGKQSSKPMLGVRPPSGTRPASGVGQHYKGNLASAKYLDGPKMMNKMPSKSNIDAAKFGYEDLFNAS